MLKYVIKHDGSVEEFCPEKLNKWAEFATKRGGSWSEISLSTYKRLPETAKSSDIHQAMIGVCLDKEDIAYSRIAARLELASLRKNMERYLGIDQHSTFEDVFKVLTEKGLWNNMPDYDPVWEDWFKEANDERLEYWQLVQWGDKYSLRIDREPVETPHIGAIGIALGLHGNSEEAYNLAMAIIRGQVNLPTPALNGIRNGDYDTISCCVISGGDTVESILAADHIAARMTAKKAGIGITYDTRSKGSPVKGGAVEHLGKHSIYAKLDRSVKLFTQITRGGSATVTFKCIDPEVESIIMWKTQKVDIETRLDKLDYSFAYNDAFVEAVVKDEDWHLFDLLEAPDVHEAFHSFGVEAYGLTVEKAMEEGRKHKTIKARDLLKTMLIARNETGRVYSFNVSRANTHTPFIDPIHLSNLCQEIALPTVPYETMNDLYVSDFEIGGPETAFCTLAAINAAKVAKDQYEHIAEVALRAVDRMMDLAPMMTPSMQQSMQKRRSAGIGIMGMASWLYNQGMDYDGTEASFEAVGDLSQRHYYYLLKASQKLSQESGVEVEGIDTGWLPIDTRVGKNELDPELNWEVLRNKPRKHSVLVAHMPTESSSLLSSGPNSVYPVRQKVINKKSRKGVVQYICDEWAPKNKLAWDVDNITLAKYYGLIQDFTDQGISADYYFDPSQYEDEKKPLSELMREWVAQARFGNKSQYYMNTRDFFQGGGITDLVEDEEACEGCAL